MKMDNQIYQRFQKILEKEKLGGEKVSCDIFARGYTDKKPSKWKDEDGVKEEYFEIPSKEYALARGEELLVRCRFKGYFGDAFTDRPNTYHGELKNIPDLIRGGAGDRAIFFGTLNAVLSYIGEIENAIHCEKGNPKKCGEEMADFILENFGKRKIAHIGYQPGHLEACSKIFENYVTDMNPENIGEKKFGKRILDETKNEEIIKKVDVALITSSTFVNGTLGELLDLCEKYDTEPIIYGVSGKGATELLGLRNFCPLSRGSFE